MIRRDAGVIEICSNSYAMFVWELSWKFGERIEHFFFELRNSAVGLARAWLTLLLLLPLPPNREPMLADLALQV